MPGANVVVIALARSLKTRTSKALFVIGLMLFGLVGLSVFIMDDQTGKVPTIGLNDFTFYAEIADSIALREQGLSGRPGLSGNESMLFVFESSGDQCFWMKDMRFNIDMVWLDSQDQVTAIEQNVSPATYPNTFCHSGQKVLELQAGTAQKVRLSAGSQARLSL